MPMKPANYGLKDFHITFKLYLLFTISYFLHLPTRIVILGKVRFDVLLVAFITFLIVVHNNRPHIHKASDSISKSLYVLLLYIIASIPFVEWPGSIIRTNFYVFLKAIVFFFFTVNVIRTERELKTFIIVFIGCQLFRIFEPTWLHLTTGYWGSATYIGSGFTDRLAGSPYDTVNPNGLAFIIVVTIPLYYFVTRESPFRARIFYYLTLPICIYALILTQSRSGMIGLIVVIAGIIIKAKKKMLWSVLMIIAGVITFAALDPVHQERYLSINIYRSDVAGHESAQGRIDAWVTGFRVFLHRPLFGHGLGTSAEAGWNVIGQPRIAHNMYIEILQELGIIGFIIFLFYVKNILQTFSVARKTMVINKQFTSGFLVSLTHAMEVLIILLLVFSLASYGLKSYPWYFFGGISAVILRFVSTKSDDAQAEGIRQIYG